MSDPVSPAALPRPRAPWGARLDAVAVGLVLGFAFLSASFIARNSDLWLHLAAGRLVADGEYRFGEDPFTDSAAGRYWANHAWLSDFGLYAGYSALGGPGLVALKALAVALTAGAMLWATTSVALRPAGPPKAAGRGPTAPGRGPLWVTCGCVALAVLACAPRLFLQPTVASLLLLAVCLCCLRAGTPSVRGPLGGPAGRKASEGNRALAAVPVLIALWVNLDAWFVLGPALVGLFWVGRKIAPNRDAEPAWPRWFVPATLAACLVSPHHVHALRPPLELSPQVWGSEFRTDPRFAGVFASPWNLAALGPAGGYNLAAWAFLVLLALGAASFLLNRRAVRGWRFAVWLPFAVLAAWQSRLIPFFAVVAGPVTALNLSEVIPERRFVRSGRAGVLVGTAALIGLAWFGLLTGFANRDRAAAWDVHTDPTLRRAAEARAAERSAGAGGRVFTAHPDLGHYLAWFAPGHRYTVDSRLPLLVPAAGEYAAASRAVGLVGEPQPDDARSLGEFGEVLLYDPDAGRMTRALRTAAGDGGVWRPQRVDGGAVLLARADRGGFEPEREVFGGGPGGLPTAARGPATLAEPDPAWWSVTRPVGRAGSWAADAATVYVRLFEGASSDSPALPLLAVRAARAGAEADPADPLAWLALGRAYLAASERTWERTAGTGLSPLEHVRLAQIAAALTQSVLRNPGSAPARESLAGFLLRRNMLDAARPHAAEALRLTRRAGPLAGEPPEAFASRVGRLAGLADPLDAAVLDAENRFLVRTAGLTGDPLARARVAVELGLTQKAVDTLLAAHPDLYGAAGLGLLAELLLRSGQAAECRVLLDRAELRRNPDVLGVTALPRPPGPDGHRWVYTLPMYDWLDLCQNAAAGRYEAAAAAIDRVCARLDAEERAQSPGVTASAAAVFALEVGLGAPPLPFAARAGRARDRLRLTELLAQTKALTATRADLQTLAGVLDLERGATPASAARFEAALALGAQVKALGLAVPGEPLAARYHALFRKFNP